MLASRLILLVSLVLLQGCVSTQFSQIEQGPVELASLTVTANDSAWNLAPGSITAFLRKDAQMWTRDGLLLDRLMILPNVGNGGTLFVSNNKAIVYPEFKTGMLPNEIQELTVGSLTTLYGDSSLVESTGLRPTRIGEQRAAMFDLRLTSSDGPTLQGRALAFVANDELHLMVFLATEIYYFERNWKSAEALFDSVRVGAA